MPEQAELVNPLTTEDFDRLVKAEQKCVDAEALCEKCNKCGMDLGPQLETARIMKERLRSIRTEFFPNGRPEI